MKERNGVAFTWSMRGEFDIKVVEDLFLYIYTCRQSYFPGCPSDTWLRRGAARPAHARFAVFPKLNESCHEIVVVNRYMILACTKHTM